MANFGLFLVLIGIIFATTPNLVDGVADFFRDFKLEQVAPNVFLPVLGKDHPVVFGAVYQFCLYFGILQIPMLATRLILKDITRRTASTGTGIIFWLGAAWIVSILMTGQISWHVFVGYIIALVGICLVAENVIVLATRRRD